MPNGGLFQPKAPDLLGLASGIEQIRAGRERRGLQRQALGLQQQQFQLERQQAREKAIAQETQNQFDRAATLLKNAPTDELILRSANIIGNILGIEFDPEMVIKNKAALQKGIGNIITLSAKGEKQAALDLSIGLANQFSTTPGVKELGGLQTGLLKGISETRERERRRELLGAEEPVGAIEEEGIPITEPEGFIRRPTFAGEQILEQFGPAGLTVFEEEGTAGLSRLGRLKAPVIRDVNIGGGKVQTQGVDPATGETVFTVGKKFTKNKAKKSVPFKEGQVTWLKIGTDPSGKPSLEDSILVDTIGGKISKSKERSLKKQGFINKDTATIKLRLENPSKLDTLLSTLAGTVTGQPAVLQAPQGALTFEQFLKREQARDPNITRVDALENYIEQIEAAR
jgi:hypothetical protein